jgi:APA family basic amino acid/polyamine antiporter
LFSGVVIVAVLGSLSAVVMSAPRVYFAMARDGLFMPALAAIHPRFETPARAISLQAGLASVLVVLGTFNTIISYFVFVVVIFIALTVIALFVLRYKTPGDLAYPTPGYPATPIVFLVLITLLLLLLAGHNPAQAFLGVAVVALGLPVYYLMFRRKTRDSRIDDSEKGTTSL